MSKPDGMEGRDMYSPKRGRWHCEESQCIFSTNDRNEIVDHESTHKLIKEGKPSRK